MKKTLSSIFIVLFAALSALPLVARDFSGETVEWIIPFGEGGGSDKWARFYAPLLSKALPGEPTVVVKNVPGAGSTKGANFFARRAKPDGLTILGTSGSTQFPYLLGDKRVKYEYKDWEVVLATPTGGVAYFSPSTGAKNARELVDQKVELLYGSQGATSLDLVPLLAFELIGFDVEPIFGMKGRSAGRLAFERNETNIDYQTSSAFLSKSQPLVDEGKAIPLFSWGALDAQGNIVRDPTFPDLPSFPEAYENVKGEKPSGPAWKAWKTFFIAGFPSQKMVFLPKGTAKEIVDDYVNALNKVIDAPGFSASSAKRLGVYPQFTGAEARSNLNAVLNIDPESAAWVKSWLKRRFNANL